MTSTGSGREIPHDVHRPLLLGLVEQLLDGVDDKRAPGFHRLGGEVAVHDPPHVEVLRTIVLYELVALVVPDIFVEAEIRLVDRRISGSRIVLEDRRQEQLVMAGQPGHIVMPGDDPQPVGVIPVHRVLVAQSPVIAIGVGDDIRSKHVIVNSSHNLPPHNLSFPQSVAKAGIQGPESQRLPWTLAFARVRHKRQLSP